MIAPPFRWFGDKSRDAVELAALLPEHNSYVEPFAGTWAVGLAKRRSATEAAYDANPLVVNLLTVIRDRSDDLLAVLPSTVPTLEEYMEAQAQCWAAAPSAGKLSKVAQAKYAETITPLPYGVELAAHTLLASSIGYNGRLYGDRIGDTWRSPREAQNFYRWRDRVKSAAERLRGVEIARVDAFNALAEGDADTCYFVDPPYIRVTDGGGSRSDRANYGPGEAPGVDWHFELIERMDACLGNVLLTVGDDTLYGTELSRRGWQSVWRRKAQQRKRGTDVGHVGWLKKGNAVIAAQAEMMVRYE